MTISYIGMVDCFIDSTLAPVANHCVSDAFVNVYNLLTSPDAVSMGVQKIATNFGQDGTGMGFWDSPTPSKDFAFACFCFTSGSTPWYLLIQYSGDTSIQNSPNGFAKFSGNSQQGIGYAFAIRGDGGNPWNGTTRNDGTDTKGDPVWISGSSTVALFPRSNGPGGDTSLHAEGLILLSAASALSYGTTAGVGYSSPPYTTQNNSRVHFIAAPDHFVTVVDQAQIGSCDVLYFGKYTSAPGIPNNTLPYVTFSTNNWNHVYELGWSSWDGGATSWGLPAIYGTAMGGNSNGGGSIGQGGIVNPITKRTSPYIMGFLRVLAFGSLPQAGTKPPQSFMNPSPLTGKFDIFNIPVALGEAQANGIYSNGPMSPAFLGEITFVKYVSHAPSNTLLGNGQYACFGAAGAQGIQIAVPWSPSYSTGPGSNTSRKGFQFKV